MSEENLVQQQRRRRQIAMSTEELDSFLDSERTCRLATSGADGTPHVTPVWYVWADKSMWIASVVTSQRWRDIERTSRVGLVVDAGHDYSDLRGVEMRGTAVPVGEIPRIGEPCTELELPESLFGAKYSGRPMEHDGKHAWLRISPDSIVSWDFRKLQASR